MSCSNRMPRPLASSRCMARCTICCGVIFLNQSSATTSALQVISDCDARKLSMSVGTRQAGNSEKGRDRLGITDRRLNGGNAAINLVLDQRRRQVLEGKWMIEGVRADRVACIVDASYQIRVDLRHPANEEIVSPHALRRQDLENDVGVWRESGPSSKVITTSWSLSGSVSLYCMLPTWLNSLGLMASTRLVPSASGLPGHSAAEAGTLAPTNIRTQRKLLSSRTISRPHSIDGGVGRFP